METASETTGEGPLTRSQGIGLCNLDINAGQAIVRCRSELESLPPRDEELCATLERPSTLSGRGGRSRKTDVVIASLNCEGWKSPTISTLLDSLSNSNRNNIVLCLQETWLYTVPKSFLKEVSNHYNVVHETSMDVSVPRRQGRPFGGVCMIISKDLPFKISYLSKRCISITLTDNNVLISNVYMPFNDSRKTAEQNLEIYLEAIGHINASHEIASDVNEFILVGDVNCAPSDRSPRKRALDEALSTHSYTNTDLRFYGDLECSHKSGRLIDRFFTSESVSQSTSSVVIEKSFLASDHFPVVAKVSLNAIDDTPTIEERVRRLNWRGASEKALQSYSRLCDKYCSKSLRKFQNGDIDAHQLYSETVSNMQEAALCCIPKFRAGNRRTHNVPLWRERMSHFQDNVNRWLTLQAIEGGPTRCSSFVRQQLRLARSRYRRELRCLRREIEVNVAEHITTQNCYNTLFRKDRVIQPSIINGHNKSTQPEMWREHFKSEFRAEEQPYSGSIFDDIDNRLGTDTVLNNFSIHELNNAIREIDTNKSYHRHYHWKHLNNYNHSAKFSILTVLNSWGSHVLENKPDDKIWDIFDTQVNPIPKAGKRDLTIAKNWRPISIGTSENWLLEKILSSRLDPYLQIDDAQFGYKKGHSANHAIELIRILEKQNDCHACFLDASAAFDRISWLRIKDQLVKRNVPLYLIKLCIKQLTLNRISICRTKYFYPRSGIKQGGVLSGKLFSSCYDDLVIEIKKCAAGVLLKALNDTNILIQVLIYCDDVILTACTPYGLRILINVTLSFASSYSDITFNPAKSVILRLGTDNADPISVCNIPTSRSHIYLGVGVGKAADPQRDAACKLYTRTNVLLKQCRELHKCSRAVKNVSITSYGSVYGIENMTEVTSKLRAAHRYLTRAVHTDWREIADLPGPNIRSRTLYTSYGVDSIEVVHRRRRNNFLIKAESSENSIISKIIGNLPRITV